MSNSLGYEAGGHTLMGKGARALRAVFLSYLHLKQLMSIPSTDEKNVYYTALSPDNGDSR